MADNLPTETDTNFLQIDAAHFRNVGRYVNFILNFSGIHVNMMIIFIRILIFLGIKISQLTIFFKESNSTKMKNEK